MADPVPIRQTVAAALRGFLGLITKAGGYDFDVGPTRVFRRDVIRPDWPVTPCIALLQMKETPHEASFQGYDGSGGQRERSLTLRVAFMDEYSGDDPDDHAGLFIANIQRAVPLQTNISIEVSGATHDYPITLNEVESELNVGPAMDGRVYGWVDFRADYRTMTKDPRRL